MKTSLTWLGRLIEAPGSAEWQQLMGIYQPLIAVWATRAGVEKADVDDVVQEVLIVVVKKVPEFEHRHPGAFRGWLRAILANQLRKYFREKPSTECRISLESISDPSGSDSQQFDREHDEFLAARAMELIEHEFEPTTWIAFRLQVLEDQRPRDVADQLKISCNAAIKAKCRVLRRLREALTGIV